MLNFNTPKYVVARVWPSWLNLFSFDLLSIWKDACTEKWYDGYHGINVWKDFNGVVDHHRYLNQATIFDDREYAESVAVIMQDRWKGTHFNVIEIPPTS